MTAYIIFQRDATTDQAALDRYGALADATFEGHDVHVRVDYGNHEVLEGEPIEGVVVLEFPDVRAARSWYHGDAYQAVAQERQRGATYRAVLVEGADHTV